MKVKIKFNRRYSMVITLVACACSLWLMMNNFHFPAEEVLRIALICFMLVLPMIAVAALIGFISRKISDRYLDDLSDLSVPSDEAAGSNSSHNTGPNTTNNNSGQNNATELGEDDPDAGAVELANPHSTSKLKDQENKHS